MGFGYLNPPPAKRLNLRGLQVRIKWQRRNLPATWAAPRRSVPYARAMKTADGWKIYRDMWHESEPAEGGCM